MGKFYDAFEKTGRAKDLMVAPAVKATPGKGHMAKNEIKVLNPKRVAPEKTAYTAQIDPHLVTYHDPTSVEVDENKIPFLYLICLS